MLIGISLNGGVGRIRSRSALVLVGLAALSIPSILFAAVRSTTVRQFVFRPNTNISEIMGDLTVLGLIGGVLGLAALASAVFQNVP